MVSEFSKSGRFGLTGITVENIRALAQETINPHTNAPFGRNIRGVAVVDGRVAVDVVTGYPVDRHRQDLIGALETTLLGTDGVSAVTVEVSQQIASHEVQGGLAPLEGVKNIIAVASGKGGVGKSTVAVNLAFALQAQGASVGLLDADIYGPSLPRMLGLTGPPKTPTENVIEPISIEGVQAMSIGVLVDTNQAMIWRGPMATQALQQMLSQTAWHDLDYLILDLPPGTGDIQLTLAQRIPVSGVVTVTTPQAVAVDDVRRAVAMFNKVNIPILGVIENMSTFVCPCCQEETAIFGEGGGQQIASEMALDLLGQIPLNTTLGRSTDTGASLVQSEPESVVGQRFMEVATKVAARLAEQQHNRQVRMPKIKIVE